MVWETPSKAPDQAGSLPQLVIAMVMVAWPVINIKEWIDKLDA